MNLMSLRNHAPAPEDPSMTTWLSDAEHDVLATVVARLCNEGSFDAFAKAVKDSSPCTTHCVFTPSTIKIAIGEHADIWPESVRIDLAVQDAKEQAAGAKILQF